MAPNGSWDGVPFDTPILPMASASPMSEALAENAGVDRHRVQEEPDACAVEVASENPDGSGVAAADR
ncbi:hypothetical protein ACFVAV_31095 [Nocardia sp. NPDC057663]|uniref:hypothetical protein n=1 Tax=Nocardia sp. NPDC057663 TaxID=3346201 RepID=UPI00366DE2E1